jgi:hypothetical protein
MFISNKRKKKYIGPRDNVSWALFPPSPCCPVVVLPLSFVVCCRCPPSLPLPHCHLPSSSPPPQVLSWWGVLLPCMASLLVLSPSSLGLPPGTTCEQLLTAGVRGAAGHGHRPVMVVLVRLMGMRHHTATPRAGARGSGGGRSGGTSRCCLYYFC